MSENISKKFIDLRTALNLPADVFGARINISPAYVSLIENGHRYPSQRVIASLFTEYGISRDWWERGEGEIFADRAGELQKSLSSEDVELLNLWRDIDEDDRLATVALLRALAMRHRR